jgi:hypothetical protein
MTSKERLLNQHLSYCLSLVFAPYMVIHKRDEFAHELAWILVDFDTDETVSQRPFGYYQYENEVNETVLVRPGNVYTFTIFDLYGDGITKDGYYQILATNGDGNLGNEMFLVAATRFTGREQERTFLAPYLPLTDDDNDRKHHATTIVQSSNVPTSIPSTTPSANGSMEPSTRTFDFSHDAGRLCIAIGNFCRHNNSCCSLSCHFGFCVKDDPTSRTGKRIHSAIHNGT